jgi:hypothetical protein
MAADCRKPWKKVLYERQEYPDNYVDKTFLQEMRKNVSTKTYELQYLMWHSGVVAQQLSRNLSKFLYINTIYLELNDDKQPYVSRASLFDVALEVSRV